MDGPQIWTVIGVLSATVVGMVTFGFTMILRVIRLEIGGLRSDVRVRLDQVDRDINAIMKHLFGIDRE